MYEVKFNSRLVAIKAIAVKIHQTPGLKSYKMEFHHEDGTITQAEHRYDVHGVLAYASDIIKCYPDTVFTIDNEIEDPIKKTLPPTHMAQLSKTTLWSNRLAEFVKQAWDDGVMLDIVRYGPMVNVDAMPRYWETQNVSTLTGLSGTTLLNAPASVVATSVKKQTVRNLPEGVAGYQYLGQYFPKEEVANKAVITELSLPAGTTGLVVPGHPLFFGNMEIDPAKTEAIDIHNPIGNERHATSDLPDGNKD